MRSVLDFPQEEGVEGYDAPMHELAGRVIAQRGSWWAKQSLRAQQECWQRAREHQRQRSAELKEMHDDLMSRLDELLVRQKEESEKVPPMCMSAAAVSEEDLEGLQQLLDTPAFCSPKRLQVERCMLTLGPPPERVSPLPDGEKAWSRPEQGMPDWAKRVAQYRDFS